MFALSASRCRCVALGIGLVSATAAVAAEPEPLHQRIDQLVAATPDYATHAAPRATDAEFLRRICLDLAGTIPTAAEARAFLADNEPAKRARLIDKLLGGGEFARHMAYTFDALWMDRRPDGKVPRQDWHEFLRTAFEQNKPYDQLVREILSADGADPQKRAPAKFLLDRNMDAFQVTRDVSRLFLGRNIQCAQCHDHPNVEAYLQQDFYGVYAFFSRSSLFPNDRANNAAVAEKADGEVTFVNVFDTSKTTRPAAPQLPGGAPLTEPKLDKGKEYTVAPAKDTRPVPAFSRRAQFAVVLTAADNLAFRRTAANRLWALLMGRGLVHPLDMDHDGNLPSHPELLDLLAEELAAHKYDVKGLLREIALSQTYQRASAVPEGGNAPEPEKYLAAPLKPLAPHQLALAVLQASGKTDVERRALKSAVAEPALHARLAPQVTTFERAFTGKPGQPEADFQATLDQALFLKHGAAVRGLLVREPGNLLDRLTAAADARALADELFLSVLTRLPTDEERADVAAVLQGPGDRSALLGEVAWALIASAEFRFNH